MFTGIITAIGEITHLTPKGDGLHLTVITPANYLDDVAIGDSIAMNGACMTVTTMQINAFEVDVSKESISKTTGLNQLGSVNLEKALRFNHVLS